MNTCYKHFYYFVSEFSLVDKKELEPLVSIHFIVISAWCMICSFIKVVVISHNILCMPRLKSISCAEHSKINVWIVIGHPPLMSHNSVKALYGEIILLSQLSQLNYIMSGKFTVVGEYKIAMQHVECAVNYSNVMCFFFNFVNFMPGTFADEIPRTN